MKSLKQRRLKKEQPLGCVMFFLAAAAVFLAACFFSLMSGAEDSDGQTVYAKISEEATKQFDIISKERTKGGLNKRAISCALLFSTLLVFPN